VRYLFVATESEKPKDELKTGRNFERSEGLDRKGKFFSNPLSETAFHSQRSFHVYRSRLLLLRVPFHFFCYCPNFISPRNEDIKNTFHWISMATIIHITSINTSW